MSEQVEPYAPKPGSIPWRVVKYLQENPGAELSKREIGRQFNVDNLDTITTLLQLACARDVLIRGRNSLGDLTWRLGGVPCVLATTRPVEETPAVRQELVAAAPAPDAGKWTPATPRVLPVARPGYVLVEEGPMHRIPDEQIVRFPPADSNDEAATEQLAEVQAPPDVLVPTPAEPIAAPPAPEAIAVAPVQRRNPKRSTAPAKPRPAAKPYLAAILAQPLNDPARLEDERYVDWLRKFDVGHSAIFRLAHMKAVEGAVSAFAARTKTRFRIARVSQYRAGIERTA
jgi:hypothetical protein